MSQNEEQWRDAVGYEGRYRVSSLGRILSLPKRHGQRGMVAERIINGSVKRCGHRAITLHDSCGKMRVIMVHRLVASAFIGVPQDGQCVNHINGNKLDNRPGNLEWCTISENSLHAARAGLLSPPKTYGSAKISAEDAREMRLLRKAGASVSQLRAAYGLSAKGIRRVINHETWRNA